MKFSAFKEFRNLRVGSIDEVRDYLRIDITKVLRELAVGLTRLSILDNFESFQVEVTIASGAELAIRNQLRSGQIPTQKIVVRGKSGAESIVDGDTEWTNEFVYLKNVGAGSATATVLFMR